MSGPSAVSSSSSGTPVSRGALQNNIDIERKKAEKNSRDLREGYILQERISSLLTSAWKKSKAGLTSEAVALVDKSLTLCSQVNGVDTWGNCCYSRREHEKTATIARITMFLSGLSIDAVSKKNLFMKALGIVRMIGTDKVNKYALDETNALYNTLHDIQSCNLPKSLSRELYVEAISIARTLRGYTYKVDNTVRYYEYPDYGHSDEVLFDEIIDDIRGRKDFDKNEIVGIFKDAGMQLTFTMEGLSVAVKARIMRRMTLDPKMLGPYKIEYIGK